MDTIEMRIGSLCWNFVSKDVFERMEFQFPPAFWRKMHFSFRFLYVIFDIRMKKTLVLLSLLAVVLCREYKVYKQLDCGGNDIRQEHTNDVRTHSSERPPLFTHRLKSWSVFATTRSNVLVSTHMAGWRRLAPTWSCRLAWILTWMLTVVHFISSRKSLWCLVYIPTGEEPEILLWPMPSEYHSGDKIVTIDPVKLHFRSNIHSDELDEATRRYVALSRS